MSRATIILDNNIIQFAGTETNEHTCVFYVDNVESSHTFKHSVSFWIIHRLPTVQFDDAGLVVFYIRYIRSTVPTSTNSNLVFRNINRTVAIRITAIQF